MNKTIALALFFFAWSSLVHAQPQSESRTLRVHVNVEPIFVVQVAPRAGGETIEFGTVKKEDQKSAQAEPVQVDIAVFSNLGVPYQVSQTVAGPLVNEKGETLPLENFLIRADEAVYGTGSILNPEPVVAREQLLFESNANGDTDTFTANYLLQIPPTQAGGDYQMNIIYTIATKE